jgi:hypothetical protein
MKKILILLVGALLLIGAIVYQTVFNSVRTINRSKTEWKWIERGPSTLANDFFWEQFHLGNYDTIPKVIEQLSAAYIANPKDLQTVYHLGFAHIWALSERQHLQNIPGTIIDHAVLAQKYLGEAYLMNPNDPRVLSFLAASKIIVGAVSEDKGLIKEGYMNGLKSIRDWRDFGEFSMAYTMSRLPHTDPYFEKSLQWMENTAKRCYCPNIETNPRSCMQAISQLKENPQNLDRNRIVPNSWVAPHNIEGFFMFYGDLLVKWGNWQKAITIYSLAKQAPDYNNWLYKDVLENRMGHARENVALFRKEVSLGEKLATTQTILSQTAISCRACHQMNKGELENKYKHFNRKAFLNHKFYFLSPSDA